MKKLNLLLVAFLMVPVLFLTSCKEESDDNGNNTTTKTTHKILVDYLVENNLDLNNILDGWIVSAPTSVDDVTTFLADYNVIDIRSSGFADGHIPGAVNSTLANVITTAEAFEDQTKTVLVVCVTGQTAGHAVVGLRLSGYPTAKVLKWGMSGWNTTLYAENPWTSNAKQYSDLSNWSTSKNLATNASFGEPTISVDSDDAVTILEAQVTAMLAGGLAGKTQEQVLDAPSSYFINNYWAETDVDTYGHITGAYRINPLTIAGGEIYNLDPEADIVTYCWTGQTSSMITAYLKVLGYKSYSLKFGANGMIYENLNAHKWDPSLIIDLTIEK